MGGFFARLKERRLENTAIALDEWVSKMAKDLPQHPSMFETFVFGLQKMTSSRMLDYNIVRDRNNVNRLLQFLAMCRGCSTSGSLSWSYLDVDIRCKRAAVLAALISKRLDLVRQIVIRDDEYIDNNASGLFMQCVLFKEFWLSCIGAQLVDDVPTMSDPHTLVLVTWVVKLLKRCDPAKRVLHMLWPYIATDIPVQLKLDIFLDCTWHGDLETVLYLHKYMLCGPYLRRRKGRPDMQWDCKTISKLVKNKLFLCPKAFVNRCVHAISMTRCKYRTRSVQSDAIEQRYQEHYGHMIHILVKLVEVGLPIQCGRTCWCCVRNLSRQFEDISGLQDATRNGDLDMVRLLVRTGSATIRELRQVRAQLSPEDLHDPQVPLDKDMERKYKVARYIHRVTKNPRSLSHLCVLAVSHAVGAGSDRIARVTQLPIARHMHEAVLFQDVLRDFLRECPVGFSKA